MPTRAVLFDFDGTLADSFAAITASTNHVRTLYGLPELPESEVRLHVGLGLPHLMHLLVPTAPIDDAVAAYRAHHPTVMLTGTILMPGVADVVPVLHGRGLKLGVCSNKRVEFTRQLLISLGLGGYFSAVLGPDDVGVPKPDPAMLLEAIKRLGVPREETIYVGDMVVDVQSAKAAGIESWLVLGGAIGDVDLKAAKPDKVLKGFGELVGLLSSP